MQRATQLDTSLRAFSAGGTRGCVHKADDKKKMQELDISMTKGERRDKVEHPQNYGFTSYVKEAEYEGQVDVSRAPGDTTQTEKIKQCAEHYVQFMGGNRSYPVVEVLDDRRYRIRNLKEGEVAMYDWQQQKIHIQEKRIYARSPFKIEMHIIKDEPKEDGHGRDVPKDDKPSRDQTKGTPKPLSTFLMDGETMILSRTDEDGKSLSSLTMDETRLTMITYRNGQPHLMFDMDEDTSLISMQTLSEGRPHLAFTLDEENGEFGMTNNAIEEGKANLIFEMDDDQRKITIATEKNEKPQLVIELDGNNDTMTLKTDGEDDPKLEMKFNNKDGIIYIEVQEDDKLKLGSKQASRKVALMGSVTSEGDRIVSDCAKRVVAY